MRFVTGDGDVVAIDGDQTELSESVSERIRSADMLDTLFNRDDDGSQFIFRAGEFGGEPVYGVHDECDFSHLCDRLADYDKIEFGPFVEGVKSEPLEVGDGGLAGYDTPIVKVPNPKTAGRVLRQGEIKGYKRLVAGKSKRLLNNRDGDLFVLVDDDLDGPTVVEHEREKTESEASDPTAGEGSDTAETNSGTGANHTDRADHDTNSTSTGGVGRDTNSTSAGGTGHGSESPKTRVVVFNADQSLVKIDTGGDVDMPDWSGGGTPREDYRSGIRLFADPEAGTFRCYLNVIDSGAEQVIADVAVDGDLGGDFITHCVRAITLAVERNNWVFDEEAEGQYVFNQLLDWQDVRSDWPFDNETTDQLREVGFDTLPLAAKGKSDAVKLLRAVWEEWPAGTSVLVSKDRIETMTADVWIQFQKPDETGLRGKADRWFQRGRLGDASNKLDEVLDQIGSAVDDSDPRERRRAVKTLTAALKRYSELADPPSVNPDDEVLFSRLRTGVAAGVVSLAALSVVVVLAFNISAVLGGLLTPNNVVLFDRPTFGYGIPFLGNRANGPGAGIRPLSLLVATLMPPAAIIAIVRQPLQRLKQVESEIREAYALLSVDELDTIDIPDDTYQEFARVVTKIDEIASDYPEMVWQEVNSDGSEVSYADPTREFIDARLHSSELTLTVDSESGGWRGVFKHFVKTALNLVWNKRVAVTAAAGLLLVAVVFAVPLAMAFGYGSQVALILPMAAFTSLIGSFLGAVVLLSREQKRRQELEVDDEASESETTDDETAADDGSSRN